jgi:hypothetical protein
MLNQTYTMKDKRCQPFASQVLTKTLLLTCLDMSLARLSRVPKQYQRDFNIKVSKHSVQQGKQMTYWSDRINFHYDLNISLLTLFLQFMLLIKPCTFKRLLSFNYQESEFKNILVFCIKNVAQLELGGIHFSLIVTTIL